MKETKGNDAIKQRTKRVTFNSIETHFIKCDECSKLLTFTDNTRSANRHFTTCLSTLNSSKHLGKITSQLYTNKLPTELKSDLASKGSRVCSDDVRTFSLFNGTAFKNYCQELSNLGAIYGKLDYHKIGPDQKTVKNYTLKNVGRIKEMLIEHFKVIETFVVSNYELN